MAMRFCCALALIGIAGCGTGVRAGDGGGGTPDLTFQFNFGDLAGSGGDGGAGPNPCGDTDPSCQDPSLGPGNGMPFPLPSDMPPDPNAGADGVSRDQNGYLGLDSSHASFDYLWLANTNDWSRGTVSKMDSKALREVARYFSVTCSSLKTGSSMQCDGTNGCCAMDSYQQFQNRKNNLMAGPHQAVNLMGNLPSRTAVDFNGDVWVANRAFGTQSSVTKIANDKTTCIDRNKNGKIDTSSDVNGDGIIQTDCNADGVPDDLAGVKAKPCTNGMAQEFFGLDDECILLTTNTNTSNQWGRPLSLGPGAQDFGPSDAWAGTYNDGHFFRVDGTTGLTKDEADLPNGCHPYGLAIDATAIGWAPPLYSDGPLCYFDAKNAKNVGTARNPASSFGYGISLDRDQNVWVAGCLSNHAFRYTPDRSAGFAKLGMGYWTTFQNIGANNGASGNRRGIAVDSRTANLYFAWATSENGYVTRIDASTVPLPKGQDVVLDGSKFPAVKIASSYTIGVGVDRNQNIWGISNTGSVATRILVDQNGTMTPPVINMPPQGNNKCPAGDTCPYQDNNSTQPNPYTYSDFTGFGLRNFTRPKGFYSWIQKGCTDPSTTKWIAVRWDGDVPANTTLTMRARSGNTPTPDASWGQWTPDFQMSPADLVGGMPLVPNGDANNLANYLQVEFDFATMDKNATPKLKSFDIAYECIASGPG